MLGGFWPTWLLSAVAAGLSGPIAFLTLLGDYTRYISPARHASRRVLHATWLGLMPGLLLPQLFGTFTAFAARAALDYAGPLVDAAPGWYLVPLLLAATSGSVGNAGLKLSSTGLDLDAIVPRASRAAAPYTVAIVATACVFIGHYASTAQDAMTSFVLLLTAIGTPWAVITLTGLARCGGVHDADALQVFNRRAGRRPLVQPLPAHPGDGVLGARRGRRRPGGVPAPVRGPAAVADGRRGLQLRAVGGGGRSDVRAADAPAGHLGLHGAGARG